MLKSELEKALEESRKAGDMLAERMRRAENVAADLRKKNKALEWYKVAVGNAHISIEAIMATNCGDRMEWMSSVQHFHNENPDNVPRMPVDSVYEALSHIQRKLHCDSSEPATSLSDMY